MRKFAIMTILAEAAIVEPSLCLRRLVQVVRVIGITTRNGGNMWRVNGIARGCKKFDILGCYRRKRFRVCRVVISRVVLEVGPFIIGRIKPARECESGWLVAFFTCSGGLLFTFITGF